MRPIIDTSYDFAEFFVFKNHADHDAYQVDPIHQAFIADCKAYWDTVKIYDFE